MEKKKLLRALNYLFISISCVAFSSAEGSSASCQTSSEISLQARLTEDFAYKNGCSQNPSPQDSFVKLLEQASRQKVESLQKDPHFQNTLSELQQNASKDSSTFDSSPKESRGDLYIFVSFSMGEKALLNLAHEAKRYGATLVLRGFKEGSYTKTAKALQKIITETGQGVLIDPELYELFPITAVPTFVLARPFQLYAQTRLQTPIHDKLQGHVSPLYVLEKFAQEGDLKNEARTLLHQEVSP